MSKNYFYSDPHFGHEFMAKLRGFDNLYRHDQHIIEMWNSVVTKHDVVYLLGDISMHDSTQFHKLGLLNGSKRVVLGNHDSGKGYIKALLPYVDEIYGNKKFHIKGLPTAVLSHIPIHPIEFEHNYNKFDYNIHGHIHSAYTIDDPKYINVSAEVIDYIPKTLEELLNI